MGAVQQEQCAVHVRDGPEAVARINHRAEGGVDAAADQSEKTSQAKQGREDVTIGGGLQLAGGGQS